MTPVSYVILGLLHIAHMSLYDLMKAFEAGASLFYGSSAGSIKRSLDKLLAEGAVEVTRQEPGARGRREYGLTSLGRQKFATWMQGEVQGNFDVTGVARIYFLGLVPPADRPPIIARLRECITAELERLESVERQISGQEVPDTYRDVSRFSDDIKFLPHGEDGVESGNHRTRL